LWRGSWEGRAGLTPRFRSFRIGSCGPVSIPPLVRNPHLPPYPGNFWPMKCDFSRGVRWSRGMSGRTRIPRCGCRRRGPGSGPLGEWFFRCMAWKGGNAGVYIVSLGAFVSPGRMLSHQPLPHAHLRRHEHSRNTACTMASLTGPFTTRSSKLAVEATAANPFW